MLELRRTQLVVTGRQDDAAFELPVGYLQAQDHTGAEARLDGPFSPHENGFPLHPRTAQTPPCH